MNRRTIRPVIIVLALGLAAGIGVALGFAMDNGGRDEADAANARDPLEAIGSLTGTQDLDEVNDSLPDGFHAEIAAENLLYGTTFAIDGEGGGYLGVLAGERQARVYHLIDEDGDGVMEQATKFADMPGLIGSFLLRPEGLYITVQGGVMLAEDQDPEKMRAILTDLPFGENIDIHSTSGIVLGPDGKLYFGLGATCNACVEEDPRSASVMQCDIDGTSCDVYADGLRNPWDMAFRPQDDSLWVADNGPDPLGDGIAEIFDEINRVQAGHSYGFPFCWGDDEGLDCTNSDPPVLELQPHVAPAGLTFYAGVRFPPEYRDDLYVSLWGGRRVIRVEIAGDPEHGYEVDASDFARFDRPVDVVNDGNGGLLVLDSDAARAYRITYEG